jgi:hypothetical protein
LPSPGFPLCTLMALFLAISGVFTTGWVLSGFLLLAGFLFLLGQTQIVRNQKRCRPIEREIWIGVVLGLVFLSAGVRPEVLAGCSAFFLLFLEGKPRKFWLERMSRRVFDWTFFHAFLLGSFFLLYPSPAMSALVVGSMIVCLVVPSPPIRRSGISTSLSVLIFLVLCTLFDLQSPNQRIVLWHFFLSARLLIFYGSGHSWIAMGLVGFVFYYGLTHLPNEAALMKSVAGTQPKLLQFHQLSRVQNGEITLYRKVSLSDHFEDVYGEKPWILFNLLDDADQGDAVRVFDLEKSSSTEKLNPTFYLAELRGSISRTKVRHLLSKKKPNYLAMSFHRILKAGEYAEWIRFLSDRLSGGILIFTAKSYKARDLKTLLAPFSKTFPAAKILFLEDGLAVYSGLLPRVKNLNKKNFAASLSISQFLGTIEGKSTVDLDKLRQQLVFLQVDDVLAREARPLDLTLWQGFALQFYHQGMDGVAHRIIRELREWDSLGEDFRFFETLLVSGELQGSALKSFEEFSKNSHWEIRNSGTFLQQLFKERVFREFPGILISDPAERINPSDKNPWYQLILYIQARKFRDANQWVQGRNLVPLSPQEKYLIRTVWEELALPEAASFYTE